MSSSSPYRDRDIIRIASSVAASQTDQVVYAGLPGYRLRVLALHTMASALTALTFNTKGSGSGTAISPAWSGAAAETQSINLPFNPHGWFETAPGESLTVTSGAGQTTTLLLTVAMLTAAGGGNVLLDESGASILDEAGLPILDEAA